MYSSLIGLLKMLPQRDPHLGMSMTNKDEASNCVQITKKSLNMPKKYSESVNRRRTDNTMAKRTNNDLQNIYIKLQERTGKCLRQVEHIRGHL